MRRLSSGIHRRGFTLLELAIVLLISGMMMNYVLSVVQAGNPRGPDCVLETRQKLQDIRGAVERFARNNDRLPLPAARNIGTDNVNFGRESSGANIDAAGGVSFGALPWQALGLTADYAGDCWGHKYSYMVTTALTTSASSGGYLDSTVTGNITLKRAAAVTTAQTAFAYAIISHGEDGLGAVKLNWSAANPDHGWCSGSADIAYTNCLATAATLMEAEYNDGKDAGSDYFDDLVMASVRPVVLREGGAFPFCWGNNAPFSAIGNEHRQASHTPRYVIGSYPSGLTFTQISVGYYHACGLAGGAAYCWGRNDKGQLGQGGTDTVDRSVPTAVTGGLTFSAISAGQGFTCALQQGTGAPYCWGQNNIYQLGNGTTTQAYAPTAVSGGLSLSSLSSGGISTCGLTSGGVAYCWGSNSTHGALGLGNTTAFSTPQAVNVAAIATVADRTFSEISTGGNGACARPASGTIYCWGANNAGQVGINSVATPQTNPIAVDTSAMPVSSFTKIEVGNSQVCGIASNNLTYCWGSNTYGSMGKGDTATPVMRPATTVSVSNSLTFNRIYAGDGISCGLNASGIAYCWGYNANGATGDGTTATPRTSPVAVVGGASFNDLSVGATSVCGLTTAGTVLCWGQNIYAQVGDGTYQSEAEPTIFGNGTSLDSVASGGVPASFTHACGVNSSGAAYCSGYNASGRLGNNSATNTVAPVAVSMGGLTFSKVELGYEHSCALTTGGAAYCWGRGNGGQLGTGSTAFDRWTPWAVTGGHTFSDIAVGSFHGCGLASGAAYCWGLNSSGQVGNGGVVTPQASPVAVAGGLTFTEITAGANHTCGIASGAAYCWGLNSSGQVGNGGVVTPQSSPVAVSGGLTFTKIAAGANHTCGLIASGAAYCWGKNDVGQVGNGGVVTPQSSPVAVSGGLTFTEIDAGNNHSCGLVSDGKVYCWGKNDYGQIGSGTLASTYYDSPTLVSDSGSASRSFTSLAISSESDLSCGMATSSTTCTLPWGGDIPDGVTVVAYSSASPTGSCEPETRTCSGGTLSGSYTNSSCTPGCPEQVITWDGGVSGCTATMPAQAGGASTVVTDAVVGPSGSVTAACSATGLVTLSGASCL